MRRTLPFALLLACGPTTPSGATQASGPSEPPSTTTTPWPTTTAAAEAAATSNFDEGEVDLDIPPFDSEALLQCSADGTCNLLDILIVVDNSSTMASEQKQLATDLAGFVAGIRGLKDIHGLDVNADVNVMVTTTDMDGPTCNLFAKDGHVPAKGAPQNVVCTDHLERFTAFGGDPSVPETCTDVCLTPVVPLGPFINFTPDASNISSEGVGDPVVDALACIVPSGIDGCFYESPLEAMLQALDPDKPWNQGSMPFMRYGATLAIVLLTDESDCSIENGAHFDPANFADPALTEFWPDSPTMPGEKDPPNSSTCWRSSMDCEDIDADGTHESCLTVDNDVLHPVDRYTTYLNDILGPQKDKTTVMLVLGGVPHGGVMDLEFRDWLDADIFPDELETAEQKQYDFGIGPGCSISSDRQALPPGRMIDVCKSLDRGDDLRCCIASICDDTYAPALECLTAALSRQFELPG